MLDNSQEEEENVIPQEGQSTPTIAIRKSSRVSKPPQRFSSSLYYILFIDAGEPKYYDEACKMRV